MPHTDITDRPKPITAIHSFKMERGALLPMGIMDIYAVLKCLF